MVLAEYEAEWRPLSARHEQLDQRVRQLLAEYASGKTPDLAYAVIGTFGAGKTQFLYHIFRLALDHGLIPLYCIAEDLFAEVVKGQEEYTPGGLSSLAAKKVHKAEAILSSGKTPTQEDRTYLKAILDPRGKNTKLLEALLESSAKDGFAASRVLLLVDELEGQYGTLQRRVKTDDRSPMRELLEEPYLKFLALAPAGIYEMGNADQTRVKRLVIPAADVDYVRQNLVKDPGRSNSCWWLSRGKARHLFKACDVLSRLQGNPSDSEARRVIQAELDHIGQRPTQVPAAVVEAVDPSMLHHLLALCPCKAGSGKRYCIDTNSLGTGELADKMAEAFKLSKGAALLLSEYFWLTARALSDEQGSVYIDPNDLPELLCLALDHLLEYQHDAPEMTDTLGEVLSLYEKVRTDQAAVYGVLPRLWEQKVVQSKLPLSVSEIRRAFPFPVMNPIVRDHEPSKMQEQWEGNGLPLWKWVEGNVTTLFFASQRDFADYTQKDEFLAAALPDGSCVLCLLPPGAIPKSKAPLWRWLADNGRFRIDEIPQLLVDFLLSAAGEIGKEAPGDLRSCLHTFSEDSEDVLLSRKAEIYLEAFLEVIRRNFFTPVRFMKGAAPDADSVWGSSLISDRRVSVVGLALAFAEFGPEHKKILARLRDLFKGGKDDRGIGDLNRLLPHTGGYVTLANAMLPRYSKKHLTDPPLVDRLRSYWTDGEKGELAKLSRLLALDKFLQLCHDDNINRMLEALWRATRQDFSGCQGTGDLESHKRHISSDVLPALSSAEDLEKEARETFGASGLDFGEDDILVKAKKGFDDLLEITQSPEGHRGAPAPALLEALILTFVSALEIKVERLKSECGDAQRALAKLRQSGEDVLKNFWQCGKAPRFTGLASPDAVKAYISEQVKASGTYTPRELALEARQKANDLNEIAATFLKLETKLTELSTVFEGLAKEGAR